ncbi:olfactory receptor 1C1-like [Hyperolius riggenbachi]|uniref:olfactory receptor 1C1-like n=1 Tax=Hyperolius riggenbachi TaxID=752182 RepID=UPI0035A2798A
MASANETFSSDFIIMGFPEGQLHISFFVALIYLVTVLGNISVFTIVQVDNHLHSPMYFFLSCLSLLDVCYSSVTLPDMLSNAVMGNRNVTFSRCLTQLFFFVCFGGTECLLLAVMAYDRYVAICQPLHYITTMNGKICWYLVGGCWIGGFVNSTFHTTMTLKLTFCRIRNINHYFCDVLPLLHAACSDIQNSLVMLHVVTFFLGLIPFVLVTNSYIRIISTILKIHSAQTRGKVFSTCSSHLIVVTVFYIFGVFNYNSPNSGDSILIAQSSSLLYGVLPPLLNPVIYCLRNNEVKKALKKSLLNVSAHFKVIPPRQLREQTFSLKY